VSQEIVELARRSLEAFARGDVQEALEAAHPDIVSTRVEPDGAVFHGRDGLLRMVADWVEGFSDWSFRAEEYIDAGERVVVRQRQWGLGAGSGVPVEDDYWLVYEFADGRIVRFEVYADREQALRSAGLLG
jgi:ketosteroid isomerase-like protein